MLSIIKTIFFYFSIEDLQLCLTGARLFVKINVKLGLTITQIIFFLTTYPVINKPFNQI